jgi:DNA-binding response OmpR family regulator
VPYPIIVFSVDKLRGGITKKILERNGFRVLLLNEILGMREKIAGHTPDVVIFDTYHCLAEEVRHLKNFCGSVDNTVVMLLGDSAITERFRGPNIRGDLRLSDPLDLDLIVSKVKEVFSSRQDEQNQGTDTLEGELKDFLKLH